MRLTTASLLVSNNLSLSSNFVFADSLMMIQPHRFKMQHTYKFKFDFVSLHQDIGELALDLEVATLLRPTPTGSPCSLAAPPTACPGSPTPSPTRTGARAPTGPSGPATSPGSRDQPWTTPRIPRLCSLRQDPSGTVVSDPLVGALGATHCRGHSIARLFSVILS